MHPCGAVLIAVGGGDDLWHSVIIVASASGVTRCVPHAPHPDDCRHFDTRDPTVMGTEENGVVNPPLDPTRHGTLPMPFSAGHDCDAADVLCVSSGVTGQALLRGVRDFDGHVDGEVDGRADGVAEER